MLWKGYRSVHTRFSVRQIENVRKQHPTAKVIVHPECLWDVGRPPTKRARPSSS